jgi:hypothetical protein
MAMITNIQDFMNSNVEADDLPAEAKELLNLLTSIIKEVARDYDEDYPSSTVFACRNASNPVCDGDVVAWVSDRSDHIHWGCTDCEDEGVITHWQKYNKDLQSFLCWLVFLFKSSILGGHHAHFTYFQINILR